MGLHGESSRRIRSVCEPRGGPEARSVHQVWVRRDARHRSGHGLPAVPLAASAADAGVIVFTYGNNSTGNRAYLGQVRSTQARRLGKAAIVVEKGCSG